MNPDSAPFPDEDGEVFPGPEPRRAWGGMAIATVVVWCVGGMYGGLHMAAVATYLMRGYELLLPLVALGVVLGGVLGAILGVMVVRWRADKGTRTVDEDLPTGPVPRRPATAPRARCLRGHRLVAAVAVSADGRFALTAGGDGGGLLWDLQTGLELHRLAVPSRRGVALAISPDGRLLAVGGVRWANECQVNILDAATGRELRRIEFAGASLCLAFLPHSPHLLVGGQAGLCLWDIDDPGLLAVIKRSHKSELTVSALAVSCDGRFALAGCATGAMYLVSLERCKEVLRFGGHDGWLYGHAVFGVGFAPDSMRAVSAGQDGTARVWSAITGEEHRRFSGHRGGWLRHGVVGAAWLPGGRVVSAGRDGSLCVWEVDTGAELCRFDHGAEVTCLAATPDGRLALTGGTDGLVRVWEMPAADAPGVSRDRITNRKK